ncbi:OprD family outer membrane porin [Zooshikella harenae]|uniref:OprD family outer membrane porin n=1 Tax=Zooshikella harenae TaxID=2827238 RepID=A0ABS5ZE42_9GAMM|nr:OprD family outer membrane porin [Zooshikella harenae]MBU2712337.1 OprD family outer membrane porin [Zooshikella harenae]
MWNLFKHRILNNPLSITLALFSSFNAYALSFDSQSTNASQFNSDPKHGIFNISYDNHFLSKNTSQRSEIFDLDEWVHGLKVDFQSRYYFNFIGMDVSLGSATYINNGIAQGGNNSGSSGSSTGIAQSLQPSDEQTFNYVSASYEALTGSTVQQIKACSPSGSTPSTPSHCADIQLPYGQERVDYLRQPQLGNSSANEISAITQAYTKMRFGSKQQPFHVRFGLQSLNLETFSTSGSYVLPSSVFGALVSTNVSGADVYYGRFNQYHERGSSQFIKPFTSYSQEQRVKYIDVLGTQYTFENGLVGQLEMGRAGNQLKKYFGKLYYLMDVAEGISLSLDGRVGLAHGKQAYGYYDWLSPLNQFFYVQYEDYKSRYYNVTAALHTQNSKLYFGINKTELADWGSGYFYDDQSAFNSTLALYKNYNHKNELAWVIGLDYDFSGIKLPGLNLGVHYARGKRPGEDIVLELDEKNTEQEVGGYIAYTLQSGLLEGLTLGWHFARWQGFENNEDSSRFLLTYNLANF